MPRNLFARPLIQIFLLTLLVATSSAAFAAPPTSLNVPSGLTAQGAPLALRGYDPVAYFTDSAAILGKAEFALEHDGAVYRFASQQHKDAFASHPDNYLPQYGGFCAYGVALGAKFDGDPTVWKIVRGKLYLNLEPKIQELWNADIPGSVRKADTNWPKIREAAAETLKPQS